MIDRKTFIEFDNSKDLSISYLLGILADARASTLQRTVGISTAELHWQFADGWNSIGALLQHICACEHHFRIAFIERREMTEGEKSLWIPGSTMGKYLPQLIADLPVDHYHAAMAASRALLLEGISQLTTAEFQERRPGYHEVTGFNLAWVLYHLAEDEVHHRGQISILRKLYRSQAGA